MNIFKVVFLFFLTVPIVEIYLLLKIGGAIGFLPTVTLVVVTATVGVTLLRSQGFSTMKRLQDALSRGEIPAREIVEGPLLLVGGALLLTPGFFTDALGFWLLIPQTRGRTVEYLLHHHFVAAGQPPRGPAGGGPDSRQGRTIEGEFRKED
jgi:UPF0716 protein FxsA